MAKTIAWIEDNIDALDTLVFLLEKAGYHVIPLATASDALDALDELRDASLILLDVFIPQGHREDTRHFGEHTGLDLLRQLRDEGVMTPVIALTVMADDDVTDLANGLNIAQVIRKWITPQELVGHVQEVLGPEY